MDFTVGMALADFIPVALFTFAAVVLQRELYGKMSKGAFALFAAGTIDIIAAGLLKALYKLLYAAGVCDFERLSQIFFPLQSLGFVLAGIGMIAMLIHRQGTVLGAGAPAVFSGTAVFVSLMVLGLGMIIASLCVLASKLGRKKIIPLLLLSFILMLGMGYLSSKDFAEASMNWIAEGVNIAGQGLFLCSALLLRKAGLSDLKLEKN